MATITTKILASMEFECKKPDKCHRYHKCLSQTISLKGEIVWDPCPYVYINEKELN